MSQETARAGWKWAGYSVLARSSRISSVGVQQPLREGLGVIGEFMQVLGLVVV